MIGAIFLPGDVLCHRKIVLKLALYFNGLWLCRRGSTTLIVAYLRVTDVLLLISCLNGWNQVKRVPLNSKYRLQVMLTGLFMHCLSLPGYRKRSLSIYIVQEMSCFW